MATKKITKDGTTEVTINKKSTNDTYVFSQNLNLENTTLKFTYTDISQQGLDFNYTVRTGYDLILVYKYSDATGTSIAKSVTTTIKDYYKYAYNYPELVEAYIVEEAIDLTDIFVAQEGYITDDFITQVAGSNKNDFYTFSHTNESFIYDEAGNDTFEMKSTYLSAGVYNGFDSIMDYNGNDYYNLSNSTATVSLDYKGNDIYNVTDNSSAFINDSEGNDKYTVYNSGIVNEAISEEYASVITDYKGNDNYVTGNSKTDISDYAGNDNYDLTGGKSQVYDNAGNDNYTLTGENTTGVSEIAGNDKYTVKNSTQIYLGDYAGNDTYTIANTTLTQITDNLGTDIYNITNSNNTGYTETYKITDKAGADKYNLSFSKDYVINDFTGADTYNIINSSGIAITDKDIQNDKYTISEFSNGVTLNDIGGNEVYNAKNSYNVLVTDSLGNDTYNFENVKNKAVENPEDDPEYYILDNAGNDKYTINHSSNIYIYETSGNDTYTVSNSSDTSATGIIAIADSAGNDKYTANNVYGFAADDSGTTNDTYNLTDVSPAIIYDDGGKNTFNLTAKDFAISAEVTSGEGNDIYNMNLNSKFAKNGGIGILINNISIEDTGLLSNDTYTVSDIDFSGVTINDAGGDKDSLKISTLNSKNLVIGVNCDNAGNLLSGDLILFDKAKSGYTIIANYFNKDTQQFTKASGYLETITAGAVKINSAIDTTVKSVDFVGIVADVAGWLADETDYASVQDLLAGGITDDINTLISCFAGDAQIV